MGKENKNRREDKKKPTMTLKERRAKKHEKKQHRNEYHSSDEHIVE